MRILIAVHGFPPTYYAGAERAAERIVHWLVKNGHEVEVFAVEKLDEPGFRIESARHDGLTIHRLFYDIKQGDPFRNSYDYPPIEQALRQTLTQQHFDLVHLVSGYLIGSQVIGAAHEVGVPVVVTLTEYWFMCARLNLLHPSDELCVGPESDYKCVRCLMEEKRRYRQPAQLAPLLMNVLWKTVLPRSSMVEKQLQSVMRRRMLLRHALETADLVISPSQFLIDKFGEFGFDTSRFTLIRHGLPTPPIKRSGQRGSGDRNLHLGFIGQVKPHKGVDLLIDALLPLLRNGCKITLDVWGPEEESPRYVEKLKHRSAPYPAVRWNGRYKSSEVWNILSTFDVLVVPSRWYENSPTVILEAFNAGIPVIATNLGGMAELIKHEHNGLVFQLNNPDDLRSQIARLVAEPELLVQLATGIPQIKTADAEVEDIFAQYMKLINQHP